MKALRFITYACLLATCVAAPVMAAGNPVVHIRNGYVRGLPPGVANTAAYMTLVNDSDEDLVLTGAASPVAASASLHRTVRRGGVMTMEPVASAIVPAQGRLELESGGLHLMLTGLKSSLRDGNSVRLSLHFEGGFVQTVSLPVISVLNE